MASKKSASNFPRQAKDMALTVYGIPNCDTVKRARSWLDARGVAYKFHDFRKDGLAPGLVAGWLSAVPWEKLLNRRGTTWRKLPAEEQEVSGVKDAKSVMLAHPTVIKRPVFDLDGRIMVGFAKPDIEALAEAIDATPGKA
jgi:Spx/MgsR family transcriptional regulator